ncbi:hypothetical protein CRI77_23140 [Mycolicibacterium duvalii]|uniref:Uncharacterized protein n=1 Tax=Mycolicibacterium duvalii TaxID=39688 RepID=A0A7I7JYQ7_9MYCO|nr:hypothetical protein [Mycolicibacterium duvalii]MCV7369642.1 hypothetical protein [Mycolicibacterium duvalii]PEG36424.1 hypothetical protein CRI77_23140 [Mycolicibacterium duvalii]BBX16369.1 hypothetical protein MDUV_12290 [Mycolicibacterium duvalii]
MVRILTLLAACALAWAPAGGPAAAPAAAQPAPTGCAYELAAPRVVDVSGTDMVTATVTTRACDGAVTYQTVACLQEAGGPGAGKCATGNGILPAQVFTPYRPGAAYTATGRGCASKGNPPQKICTETGPLTATL